MDRRVEYGWTDRRGIYEGMASKVRIETYELTGARRSARRLETVCGECKSGLSPVSALSGSR